MAGLVRVRTLGTIDVRRAHGPEAGVRAVVSQPKRFALLAYLAAATPHGFHRRDTLLALFWPELDLAQGRHALRQSLHFLRLQLGPVVVRRGDEDVGLDPAMLWCDVPAFEQALEQGQPEQALDLYAGDFLPGFFVSGVSAEFEQWLDGERARLRAAAARAAWSVADRAEGEGRGPDASHWARRAVTLAPDDEGGVRRLMALLDRFGDRSGALRAYEQFAEGLRTEFAADPAPETQVLLQAVRQGRSAPAAVPPPPSPLGTDTPLPVRSTTDPDFDQLVGRDHVLQLLRAELKRALAGGCEPVLVLGEAGIGKTQLARYFARLARSEGARCLVAHFFDYQGSRLAPYETLLDVLASALEDDDTDLAPSLPERVQQRLGVTLPPELRHAADGGPVRAPADSGHVSAVLGRCFRRLSRERPLVLLLDDLQWADEASRQVVGYLMRTAVADPLLIVGLARLEEAEEQTHPLAAWLRQEAAARGFTSVRLRTLTDAEVGIEVARVFAASGGVTLPGAVPATLHKLTGGNPYFLVETIRFLLEHGLLIRAPGRGLDLARPGGTLRRRDRGRTFGRQHRGAAGAARLPRCRGRRATGPALGGSAGGGGDRGGDRRGVPPADARGGGWTGRGRARAVARRRGPRRRDQRERALSRRGCPLRPHAPAPGLLCGGAVAPPPPAARAGGPGTRAHLSRRARPRGARDRGPPGRRGAAGRSLALVSSREPCGRGARTVARGARNRSSALERWRTKPPRPASKWMAPSCPRSASPRARRCWPRVGCGSPRRP